MYDGGRACARPRGEFWREGHAVAGKERRGTRGRRGEAVGERRNVAVGEVGQEGVGVGERWAEERRGDGRRDKRRRSAGDDRSEKD